MPTYEPDEPCWQEPAAEIAAGDVFVDVPLLDRNATAARDEDGKIYLPTRRGDLSLLLKITPGGWWFVPVMTKEHFLHEEVFDDHFELCLAGRRPGWFPLPPFDDYADLRDVSVIFMMRPTLHRPEAFADAHDMRVASLTPDAFEGVCQSFIDGFELSWE